MDTTEKPARTLRLVSRADDYDHTNSAQAYIDVAKQFIPDLNLETDHIQLWVDPYVAIVVRRPSLPSGEGPKTYVSQHAADNLIEITHSANIDMLAWEIHGAGPRHAVLALGSSGDWASILRPSGVLLAYFAYIDANITEERWRLARKSQLIDIVEAGKEARDLPLLKKHFDLLQALNSNHSLLLTVDPYIADWTWPCRVERL